MVFGLFEGNKIEITFDKPSYKFGEEITGKVVLNLKQPKKARALRVRLYMEYDVQEQYTVTTGQPPQKVTRLRIVTKRAAEQEQALDSEKEYPIGAAEYPFKFVCQSTVLAGGFTSIKGWFLDTSLDVPMSVDISKRIRLNIS